jgi:hypothetical protein
MLGLQFENLVLKNKRLLLSALGVQPGEVVREGPYFQNQTSKHASCQIDYPIQTRHLLYVVEIKIQAFITPKNLSIRPVLIHVNGVADAVENADYFDQVIDYGLLVAS